MQKCPESLNVSDIQDFCILAKYYESRTPNTFKKYITEVFNTPIPIEENEVNTLTDPFVISQALCLPVDLNELIETIEGNGNTLNFFVVDCRHSDQYNGGHLAVAYHLDCNLMLEESKAFKLSVDNLLETQWAVFSEENGNGVGESAGCGHLCFMGSGHLEDDQYMHMAVASLLQKNTKYVSILTGNNVIRTATFTFF